MAQKKKKQGDVELRPDGWERFEKAVDAAVKSGPKPHKRKRDAEADEDTSAPQSKPKGKSDTGDSRS